LYQVLAINANRFFFRNEGSRDVRAARLQLQVSSM